MLDSGDEVSKRKSTEEQKKVKLESDRVLAKKIEHS